MQRVKSVGKFQLQNSSGLLFYHLKLITILKEFISSFSRSAMILESKYMMEVLLEARSIRDIVILFIILYNHGSVMLQYKLVRMRH